MKYQLKLNELQKEMIKKQFPKIYHLVIMYAEKFGDPKDTLEMNVDLAYDFICQDAE